VLTRPPLKCFEPTRTIVAGVLMAAVALSLLPIFVLCVVGKASSSKASP
jgi:hypothetical protein